MKYKLEIEPKLLYFKEPAGTSRGIYNTRKVWYLHLLDAYDNSELGIGECAPLPDLSCDYAEDYEECLQNICRQVEQEQSFSPEKLRNRPSILFGLETAFLHKTAGSYAFFDTKYSKGEKGIKINGLVWMGNFSTMLKRAEEKLRAGFTCIKLKIGAIDFEDELKLLAKIRKTFTVNDIKLRVDANGAFDLGNVKDRLERLAKYDIHSIEQPIRAGNWEQMARLCQESPLQIALDEELIGCNTVSEKEKLLSTLHPGFIVLKPSLHGGISGTKEWIRLAEKYGIGWWITSALESNIGLNSIAQLCACYENPLHQGLGTGLLYKDNVQEHSELKGEYLWYK